MGLGDRMKAAFSPKNLAMGLGIGIGVQQISQFVGDAIGNATALAESMSKVDVVFGESSEEIQDWAEGASTAFGQSRQSALEAVGTYGNLFQAFGVGREEATKMSKSLVELAADLASFNNTSVDDALLALRSGLSGETEPLKRYGIALSDARLRTELLAQGVTDLGATLTPMQKSQAAYGLIMKDSALAQGDFARTSGGLANQQRILQAQLEDVSAEIGTEMLPIIVDLVNFVNEDGIPALRGFIDVIKDLADPSFEAEGWEWVGQIEDFLNSIPKAGRAHREWLDELFNFFGESNAAIDNGTLRMAQHLRDGAGPFNAAAADLADGLPEEIQAAEDEAVEIAKSTPGDLANSLRAELDDYDEALEELGEIATNSVSDLAERQKIEGILASQTLTDALNSDSLRTRLLAQELVADLVADYELLGPGALDAGELVNPALNKGVYSNIYLATEAGEAVVDAAGNPLVDTSWAFTGGANVGVAWANGLFSAKDHAKLQARLLAHSIDPDLHGTSPPKHGPLKHIDEWGRNIGMAWLEGIASAANLAPGLISGALGGTAPLGSFDGGVGASSSTSININAPTVPMTPRDIGRELRRTGVFPNG